MIRLGDEAVVVKGHRGNHAGRAVGGRGHHAAAGGVLFVHRHGIRGNPVKSQRIAAQTGCLLLGEAFGQVARAAANIQAAGQDSLGRDAARHAIPHRRPESIDTLAHLFHWRLFRVARHQRAFVLKHKLADGELVGLSCGQ